MTIALPEHCTPTERWLVALSSAFGVCVPTNLAFVSTALGICSIITWLFAQMPQIYKNYKLKSASGLSIYFLTEWLLGDLANLLGCLFTDQAAWQAVLAAYYVTVDICLVSQYYWYVHAKPWRKARLVDHDDADGSHPGGSEDLIEGISPASTNESSASARKKEDRQDKEAPQPSREPQKDDQAAQKSGSQRSMLNEKLQAPSTKRTIARNQQVPLSSPRALLIATLICITFTNASPLSSNQMLSNPGTATTTTTTTPIETAGRLFSWACTLLYLLSRLPQIYKNFSRGSTSGLSPTLFIAAFFGNLFYSTSLLCNPLAWSSAPPFGLHGWAGGQGSDRVVWVKLAAPFFFGAAGVLGMDAIIAMQFLVYREGVEMEVLEEDRLGRGHWRRVEGWMRGWVPSPSPALGGRTAEGAEYEEGRPLMGRRRSTGEERRESGYGTT